MSSIHSTTVWIGLANLIPHAGNSSLEGAPGAYANVLCLARDEAEYRRMVTEAFAEDGFRVESLHDVEPFELRRGDSRLESDVPDEIVALANQLSDSEPILFDDLYVYESED